MTEPLKPCPFCGGEPKTSLTGKIGGRDYFSANVHCTCGAIGASAIRVGIDRDCHKEAERKAREKWNTRADTRPAPVWRSMDDPALDEIKRNATDVLVHSIEGIELAWWSDGQNEWMTRDGTFVPAEPDAWTPLPAAPGSQPTEQPPQADVQGAGKTIWDDWRNNDSANPAIIEAMRAANEHFESSGGVSVGQRIDMVCIEFVRVLSQGRALAGEE